VSKKKEGIRLSYNGRLWKVVLGCGKEL
jgi:hypothetical protein